jgi:Single-strand binding protein family
MHESAPDEWSATSKETPIHAKKVFMMGTISSTLTLTSQPRGSPVAEFTVTVDSQGKDETVFHLYIPCKAWGNTAESVCEHGETEQPVGSDGT